MGVPIPIGTGLFQLLHQVDKVEKTKLVDTFSKSAQHQNKHMRTQVERRTEDDLLTLYCCLRFPLHCGRCAGAICCCMHPSSDSRWSSKMRNRHFKALRSAPSLLPSPRGRRPPPPSLFVSACTVLLTLPTFPLHIDYPIQKSIADVQHFPSSAIRSSHRRRL